MKCCQSVPAEVNGCVLERSAAGHPWHWHVRQQVIAPCHPSWCKFWLAAQIPVSSRKGQPQFGDDLHSSVSWLVCHVGAPKFAYRPAGQVPRKQRTTAPSAGPAVAVHKQRAQEALAAYLNGEAEQAPWEALGMSRPPLIAGVFCAVSWASDLLGRCISELAAVLHLTMLGSTADAACTCSLCVLACTASRHLGCQAFLLLALRA